jgi:hypothetical protein
MMRQFFQYGSEIQRSVGHLDLEHWVAITVVILVAGVILLRGSGSQRRL